MTHDILTMDNGTTSPPPPTRWAFGTAGKRRYRDRTIFAVLGLLCFFLLYTERNLAHFTAQITDNNRNLLGNSTTFGGASSNHTIKSNVSIAASKGLVFTNQQSGSISMKETSILLQAATELVNQTKIIKTKEDDREEEKRKHQNEKERQSHAYNTTQQLSSTKSLQLEDMSGCLMVMDANHELIEWLAYHYHVAPLRRLIILNDGKSKTTPAPIVQRWMGLIDITLWEETDIWPDASPQSDSIKRQSFYGQCMRKLYDEGHRWVQIHDPDEFITINERVFDKQDEMYGLNVSSQTIDVPSLREPGSILKFVKETLQYVQKFGTQKNPRLEPFVTPCIPFLGKTYGKWGKKDEIAALEEGGSPFLLAKRLGVTPYDLRTWSANAIGGENPIMGKALIDFERIRKDEIPDKANANLPLGSSLCHSDVAWSSDNPLVMNHYASNWEQAPSVDNRGGALRNAVVQDHEYQNVDEDHTQILDWLRGFVDIVGETEATRLLQHAGNTQKANYGAFLHDHDDAKAEEKKALANNKGINNFHMEDALLPTTLNLAHQIKGLKVHGEVLEKEKEKLKAQHEEQNYVSGCVMIMDANHDLIEWLAYHYFALPLRRLIIFNDFNARTTPEPIIQRWKGLIDITVWNETNLWPNGTKGPGKNEGEAAYIWRQKEFTSRCMKTLYNEGRRWILSWDPDEYITINEKVYDEGEAMHRLNLTSERMRVPSPGEAGYILKFVTSAIAYVHKYGIQGNKFLEPFETPCIALHRRQYGNLEDPKNGTTPGQAPDQAKFPFEHKLSPSDLSTWRWRYWGRRETIIGKALIDFDRIRFGEIEERASIHFPIHRMDICRRDHVWRGDGTMPLIMNHYASSWEQLLFRTADSRGGKQGRMKRYRRDKHYRHHHDTNPRILQWLSGFVEHVGKRRALKLLQNAGDPETANIGAYLKLT